MINKYLGIALVASSMMVFGCSSSNDDAADMADTTGSTSGETTASTAGDMTGDTAGDTSGDTAGDTSGDTAGDTSGDTAGDTSGDTAGDTSGDMSGGTATAGDTTPVDFGNSVMGILAAQPDLTLVEAAMIAEGDLANTLNDANNQWTVFAPNDTAMEGVTADREALLKHIHAGFQNADNLTSIVGSTLGMTGGAPQPITIADDGVTLQIGGVNIVQSGIVGDNGIVHKIDGVLQ